MGRHAIDLNTDGQKNQSLLAHIVSQYVRRETRRSWQPSGGLGPAPELSVMLLDWAEVPKKKGEGGGGGLQVEGSCSDGTLLWPGLVGTFQVEDDER